MSLQARVQKLVRASEIHFLWWTHILVERVPGGSHRALRKQLAASHKRQLKTAANPVGVPRPQMEYDAPLPQAAVYEPAPAPAQPVPDFTELVTAKFEPPQLPTIQFEDIDIVDTPHDSEKFSDY